MATILRPSWLAYRLSTSIRFSPCASLPLATRQEYAKLFWGRGATCGVSKLNLSTSAMHCQWLRYHTHTRSQCRHCSSDSGDRKGTDKLASLLSSLKKKKPASDKEENKEEGVKLAQPKAKKPIKRTSGGLPKPKWVEPLLETGVGWIGSYSQGN